MHSLVQPQRTPPRSHRVPSQGAANLRFTAFIATGLLALALTTTAQAVYPIPTPQALLEQRVDRKIERYLTLLHSPMRGKVDWGLVGRKTGTSPFALVGISVVESTAGRAACGMNAWGLGACGRAWTTITLCGKSWSINAIRSWQHGAMFTGTLLRCLWPSAITVYGLAGYCSGCPSWAGQVAYYMRQMGSGSGVKWRHAREAVRR